MSDSRPDDFFDEDDDDEDQPSRSHSSKDNRLQRAGVASLALLAVVAVFYFFVFSQDKPDVSDEQKPITVLIIGNDTLHTNDVPNMLREVARISKSWRPVEVKCIAIEDYSLTRHIDEKQAQKLIGEEPWTFVVLQDRWLQPLEDPAGMLDSVRTLSSAARKRGSKVILFVPWADAEEGTRQEVLSAVSRKLAERLSLDIAPAGDVFFAVAKKHSELNLYAGDKHHVSPIGSWLAAATLYSAITNQKPKLFADQFTYHGVDGDEPHVPIVGDKAKDLETMVWEITNLENKGRKLGPPVLRSTTIDSLGQAGQ